MFDRHPPQVDCHPHAGGRHGWNAGNWDALPTEVVAELNIANGENLMINQSHNEKTLKILEAPSIPGLKFRYFQGESDYPKMKDIFDACKDVDGIEHTLTIEAIANNYEHLQRCDPFTDTIFAEVDGQPIGYSRVGWYPGGEGDYIYYSLGWIKPEWRRKGVGTAILKHNERRIREIVADAERSDVPRDRLRRNCSGCRHAKPQPGAQSVRRGGI